MNQEDEKKVSLQEFVLPERLARLKNVLQQRNVGLTLVLDHLHHVHNISAVIRTAEAFGLHRIHFIAEQFELARDITKGCQRWLEFVVHKTTADCIAWLRADGFRLVTLDPPREDYEHPISYVPVTGLPFHERLALIFGNEKYGVNPALRAEADIRAYIPMYGFVESFNISVAAGICLFCSTLKEAKLDRQYERVSEEEYQIVMEKWLVGSVREGEKVLQEVQYRNETR